MLYVPAGIFEKEARPLKRPPLKLISIVLAVLLLCSVTLPAFAATENNVRQYEHMTIFGDSITCAWGNPTTAAFAPAEGSYADLTAKAVGAEQHSLAFQGCTIPLAMNMLGIPVSDEDLAIARGYLLRTTDQSMVDRFDKVRSGEDEIVGSIEEQLKATDIVILALGSNDTGNLPLEEFRRAQRSAKKDGASDAEAIASAAKVFADRLNMSLKNFMLGYPKIIQKLKEYNKDVTIVLVGQYNPFVNASYFEGNEDFGIGNLLTPAVKTINTQLALWAKMYGCVYADVFDISSSFPEQCLSKGLVDYGGLHIHPTYEGHAWMAQQIIKALPATERKLCLPRNGEVRLILGDTDTGFCSLKNTGLFGWDLQSTENGQFIVPDGQGGVCESSSARPWRYNGGFYTIGRVSVSSVFGTQYMRFDKLYLAAGEDGSLCTTTHYTGVTLYAK